MKLNHPKAKTALKIAKAIKNHGHQALFAGGCVRDFLMNKTPADFDIATDAPPEVVEKMFKKTIPVGKQFGVILVIENQMQFEIATFRKESGYLDGRHPSKVSFTDAQEDALRRDFTVNGLFYDPFEQKVIDYVGGQKDIKKKIIRAIGDPEKRFEEDKLRLLRAVRFASTLGFTIEKKTWDALRRRAKQITKVSMERIRDELTKMFTRPGAGVGFELLSKSGLMKEVLPEIEIMKGVKQPPEFHPEGDVFVHTRMLLEKLENPSVVLAFASLFHDVGKPPTFAIRKGRITFYEHAPLGAKMTQKIMKRLKFPNQTIDAVSECVANHMKFAEVQRMRSGKLKLFVSREIFPEEMELHRIDCLSCHGKLDNYRFLKKKIEEYKKEDLKPEPFINGHDLIRIGMKPGPEMKPILQELYELQLEGKFKDGKTQALAWAKKLASKKAR